MFINEQNAMGFNDFLSNDFVDALYECIDVAVFA